MKRFTHFSLAAVLSLALAAPAVGWAQRPAVGSASRQTTTRPATTAKPTTSTPKTTVSRPASTTAKPSTPVAKPSTSTPKPATTTPKPAVTTPKPATTTPKPATPVAKPAVTTPKPATTTARPTTPAARPTTPAAKPTTPTAKPAAPVAKPTTPAATPATPPASKPATPPAGSGSVARPSNNGGNSGSAVRPGAGNQPGGNQPGGNSGSRPGGNNPGVQPGGNNPGGNSGSRPGGQPGVQPGGNNPGPGPNANAGRPGGTPFRPEVTRPHYNFRGPDYRPPRPNGGYWGPPPPNPYRPRFYAPVPPPPPRVYVNTGIPVLNFILGTAFGSFIDVGINQLYNNGYNVLGYANNMVYLADVRQLGYAWPTCTFYYNDGLLSDAQFQYWTSYSSNARYNSLYRTLVATYGAPVESTIVNGTSTSTWWAGGNTGYVTLQYGPSWDSGSLQYYTTLTYSSL